MLLRCLKNTHFKLNINWLGKNKLNYIDDYYKLKVYILVLNLKFPQIICKIIYLKQVEIQIDKLLEILSQYTGSFTWNSKINKDFFLTKLRKNITNIYAPKLIFIFYEMSKF